MFLIPGILEYRAVGVLRKEVGGEKAAWVWTGGAHRRLWISRSWQIVLFKRRLALGHIGFQLTPKWSVSATSDVRAAHTERSKKHFVTIKAGQHSLELWMAAKHAHEFLESLERRGGATSEELRVD